MGRRLAVFAAAYGAVVLWGATPIVTKLAVAEIDPLAVGLLRTLLAGVAVLPLNVLGRLKPPASREGRTYLAVSALGGFVIFPVLFSLGIELTTAGQGALLLGILPVLTGLIAALLERRVPGRRWWLGCAVALAGTAVLVGERFDLGLSDLSLGDGSSLGNLLVLASAVAAAAGYVAGARAARETGTWAITLWGLMLGSLALLPFLPFMVSLDNLATAGATAWTSVIYLAVASSIVAYAAWYWALGQGGIGRIGLAQFVQPLVGVVLAVALLGEAVTWPMVAAAAAILAGVALARGRG